MNGQHANTPAEIRYLEIKMPILMSILQFLGSAIGLMATGILVGGIAGIVTYVLFDLIGLHK